MTDLKGFIQNNGKIIAVLYIVLLIIVLLLILDELKFGKILRLKEFFTNPDTFPKSLDVK